MFSIIPSRTSRLGGWGSIVMAQVDVNCKKSVDWCEMEVAQ